MSETPELLPCPFCGSEACSYTCEEDDGRDFCVVSCMKCEAMMEDLIPYLDKAEDTKARQARLNDRWNTRATETRVWNEAIEAAAAWHISRIEQLSQHLEENNERMARMSGPRTAAEFCKSLMSTHSLAADDIRSLRRPTQEGGA